MILARDIQLGPCQVHIETDSPEVHEQLAYMDQEAIQSEAPVRTLELAAWIEEGGYRLVEDGREHGSASCARDVLEEFYSIGYREAFAALPAKCVRLHAVTVSLKGRRALLLGSRHSGKTTLAVRLLCEGLDVSGDEYAIAGEDGLCAFPRRFHIKDDSLTLLPELAPVVDDLPYVGTGRGRVVALSPTDLGMPWVLQPARVDAVVTLDRNHGGPSSLKSFPQYELLHRLMTQTYTPAISDGGWIAKVCDLVSTASCWRLELGDLESAVFAVRGLLG